MNLNPRIDEILKGDPLNVFIGGNHYKQSKTPSIYLVQSIGDYFGFSIANAVKYLIRCKQKGQFNSDIEKSFHYLKLEFSEFFPGLKIRPSVSVSIFNKLKNGVNELDLDTDIKDLIISVLDWASAPTKGGLKDLAVLYTKLIEKNQEVKNETNI